MKAILTTLALLALPVASPLALAQSDGTLGSSSTGTLNFNVKINDANRIQIFGFGNIQQNILSGEETGIVTNTTFFTGVPTFGHTRPCITADLPDTKVTLDWAITPLTDTTNSANVLGTSLLIRKNVSSLGNSGARNIIVNLDNFSTQRTGTVSGVETKTGSHGRRCSSNDEAGRLSYIFQTSNPDVRAAAEGTYVSILEITVSPE